MMIKAIIFDFYGVISTDEYWNIVKRDKNIISDFSKMADEVNLGLISWDKFVKKVAAQIAKPVVEINAAYESEQINKPLLGYIDELHKRYKTGLLSNASYEFFKPQAEELGFKKLFDSTVVSSQVGFVKPQAEIYKYILDRLAVTAAEAVYIDDVQRFCGGAEAVGIKSIWYRDFQQMKAELENLLAK